MIFISCPFNLSKFLVGVYAPIFCPFLFFYPLCLRVKNYEPPYPNSATVTSDKDLPVCAATAAALPAASPSATALPVTR